MPQRQQISSVFQIVSMTAALLSPNVPRSRYASFLAPAALCFIWDRAEILLRWCAEDIGLWMVTGNSSSVAQVLKIFIVLYKTVLWFTVDISKAVTDTTCFMLTKTPWHIMVFIAFISMWRNALTRHDRAASSLFNEGPRVIKCPLSPRKRNFAGCTK